MMFVGRVLGHSVNSSLLGPFLKTILAIFMAQLRSGICSHGLPWSSPCSVTQAVERRKVSAVAFDRAKIGWQRIHRRGQIGGEDGGFRERGAEAEQGAEIDSVVTSGDIDPGCPRRLERRAACGWRRGACPDPISLGRAKLLAARPRPVWRWMIDLRIHGREYLGSGREKFPSGAARLSQKQAKWLLLLERVDHLRVSLGGADLVHHVPQLVLGECPEFGVFPR